MAEVRTAIENCIVEYSISCPRCGKAHIFKTDYVDNIIECECGFGCYAFAVGDFRIIMSKAEAENEEVVRSMRRFVISTGRCEDIPPELYMDDCSSGNSDYYFVRDYDIEGILEQVLEEYQESGFGEYLVTKELLDSICESLSNGRDVELKRKKDSVEIIELKKKRISTTAKKAVDKTSDFCVLRRKPIKGLNVDTLLRGMPDGILQTPCQSLETVTTPKI